MSAIFAILTAVIGGSLAGLLALGVVLWSAPARRARRPHDEVFPEPRSLIFRHGYLVEHSDNVGFLLPDPINHLSAWDDLVDSLADLADGASAAFADLQDHGRPLRLDGEFGRDRITVIGNRDGEHIRITVAAADAEQSSIRMDVAGLSALEAELDMLARAHATATALSWVSDAEHRITWANAAYIDLVSRCHGPDAAHGWPLIALFPNEGGAPSGISRRKVTDREGHAHWFEVTASPPDETGLRYHHGVSLAAAIQAEDGRRAFIQTLTKTFAVLPTGVAIFDPDGQLAQFNPALMDMTGLDPQWLSRRPRLADVFDALRERKCLPEPRNYKAWRNRIAALGDGPVAQAYHETWTLPSGATYRLTASRQGDGAVTLLFEDVSADVSAARAAQDEQTLLAAILDASDEAILAFNADGTRHSDNVAARDLWLGDDGGTLPDTLDGCIALWQNACRPNPAWGDLRSFARQNADRAEWTERLWRDGAIPLDMRVTPLPGNRLSVAFLRRPDAMAAPASSVTTRQHAAE